MTPRCRRCHAPLVMTIAGVVRCVQCPKLEHDQIDRLIAGSRAESVRADAVLTAQADEQQQEAQ